MPAVSSLRARCATSWCEVVILGGGLDGIEDDVRVEDSALDIEIAAGGDCLEACYSYGVRLCPGWFLSPSQAGRFWSW